MILFTVSIFTLTACTEDKNSKEDALNFKEEYESLNGQTNNLGKENRTISIRKDNPSKTVEASEIINLMNNKKTFYIYFGFPTCPWCRSVIEKSIEIAQEKNISKIYYVNILEIRDKMEVVDEEVTRTTEGSKDYYELIELLSNVLSDYELQDENGNSIDTGEKRIYAPNFVYIENGKVVKLIEGISESQTDSRMELTDEILEDEKIYLEISLSDYKT